MVITFPEFHHPLIQTALGTYNAEAQLLGQPLVEALPATDLATACQYVVSGQAAALVAGIEYSSRDVILACRQYFGMGNFADSLEQSSPIFGMPITREPYQTFSGLAVMRRGDETYLLADVAACKHPTREQLIEIIQQTYLSACAILSDQPRIALLSFSTNGSGGQDPTMDTYQAILSEFQGSDLIIDGEMQLDAAINPEIGAKKFPDSPVAGHANVLIAPDLNSGNLLYKAFEHIGGFTVAGPILQGFNYSVSDLSRGSSLEDITFTLETMIALNTYSEAFQNLSMQ